MSCVYVLCQELLLVVYVYIVVNIMSNVVLCVCVHYTVLDRVA